MRIRTIVTGAVVAAYIAGNAVAGAQVKKPPVNQTKGQAQTAGGVGQFGVTYSLKSGFNFTILSAKYTLDPFTAYESLSARDGQKMLVLDVAIKNINPSDNYFNTDALFAAYDETGAVYHPQMTLQSSGVKGWPSTLKPGQGLGQPALHNPLQVGFMIPDKARIVKVMLNTPLLLQKVDMVRYYIAGATKEEAGEAGNPKNIIAPLPDYAKDAKDKSGAVALDEAAGTTGVYLPSGSFALRLDSFKLSADLIKGYVISADKQFAIATITAKYLGYDDRITMFHVIGGDFPSFQITNSEGDRSKPIAYLKAARDEEVDHTFQNGDEYQFRLIFTLPKEDTVKKLVLGSGQSHKFAYDVSTVK